MSRPIPMMVLVLMSCAPLLPRPPQGAGSPACATDADCLFDATCVHARCEMACDQEEDCWRHGGFYLVWVHCRVPANQTSSGGWIGLARDEASSGRAGYCQVTNRDDLRTPAAVRKGDRWYRRWEKRIGYEPGPRELGGTCATHEDCSIGSRCQSEADVAALGEGAPPAGTCVPWCRFPQDCIQWDSRKQHAVCVQPGPHGYCQVGEPE